MIWRGPRGYSRITDPDGGRPVEVDTQTCQHCNVIIDIPVTARPEDVVAARCGGCWQIICLKCKGEQVRTGTCDPIWKKLERMEAAGRFLICQ